MYCTSTPKFTPTVVFFCSESGADTDGPGSVTLSVVIVSCLTMKIDGPPKMPTSIFMVKQDTITSLTVTEPGPSVNAPLAEVKKTTVGFNAGVDLQYLIRKDIAVGGIARYTWGSADIDGADDKLTVGGFQIGVGVRYRFK